MRHSVHGLCMLKKKMCLCTATIVLVKQDMYMSSRCSLETNVLYLEHLVVQLDT